MTTGSAATVLASIALIAAAVPAVSHGAEVRPAIVAGFDTGGDRIVNVTFMSGDTDSIRANEGVYLGGGISVLNDSRDIEFLGTANVKYASIHASNGDISWTRFPFDALLFYRMEKFRVGAGATYVVNPKLKGSGVAGDINTTVDNAIGALVQADYLLGKVALGLRYTALDFKAGGNTIKSSGVGITFGFTF